MMQRRATPERVLSRMNKTARHKTEPCHKCEQIMLHVGVGPIAHEALIDTAADYL